MPIFVDTDNSNPKAKLYNGAKAGQSATLAEKKMQDMTKKLIGKAPDFTTIEFDNAKGYAIRLEISKIEITGQKTTCGLSGSIVRYPAGTTLKRGKGEEMLSTGMTSHATADGTSEGSMLDCVEAITESLITKAIPIMRADMPKR